MALYFIRHGESESNERNLFAGRFDTPLTKLGRLQAAQARRLVEKLNMTIDEVHYSPLSRAKETALIVVPDSSVKRVESTELVERDFGILSEQNKSLIKKYYGETSFEHMFHSADGLPLQGETFTDMYDRCKRYYDEVLLPKESAGKNLVIVAHKYIIEMFALIAAEKTPKEYHDFRVPNCKPCSWVDLQKCVDHTSPALNHFAEFIEARLATLLVLAVGAGLSLRLLFQSALPTTIFTILTLFLLAVNSGLALLRLDNQVFWESFKSVRRVWKSYLLRAIVGFTILILAKEPVLIAIGTFLLLPSAMTAPTLSLSWGGDYFLSFQTTLVMSLLSPLAIWAATSLTDQSLLSTAQLGTFLFALAISVVLPGFVAQILRRRRPIQAGAISTNWGWIGGAVMVPLAFLVTFQFAPSLKEIATMDRMLMLRDLILTGGLFILIRLFGVFATKISQTNSRANLDRYITHIAPNIFFWFTLLPSSIATGNIRLFTCIAFFISIYFEERRFVKLFPLGLKEPITSVKNSKELLGLTVAETWT